MSKFIPVKFIEHDDVSTSFGISQSRKDQILEIMETETDKFMDVGGGRSTQIMESCYNAVQPESAIEILFVGYLVGCLTQDFGI